MLADSFNKGKLKNSMQPLSFHDDITQAVR